MLLLRYLQLLSTCSWSLSNQAALLRYQLFVHCDLFGWLMRRLKACPNSQKQPKPSCRWGLRLSWTAAPIGVAKSAAGNLNLALPKSSGKYDGIKNSSGSLRCLGQQ